MATSPPSGDRPPLRRAGLATLAAIALWGACGLYAFAFAFRGWVPHDEGTIGQSAERVLLGEVPHRDFDEVYTGGLTYLHAGAMKLLGISLRAPRLTLFVGFLLFLAAAYRIAREISSRSAALLAMAGVTLWSVPNYFVSLPSWYNLFFATFGVLALMRFATSRSRAYLVLAGVCGGLSLLAKIAGLFFLAAGVVFLAAVEQSDTLRTEGKRPTSPYWVIVGLPAALAAALTAAVSVSRPSLADALQLFVPVVIVCAMLPLAEWQGTTDVSVSVRLRRLAALLWPFAAGALIPLGVFAAVFLRAGAMGDLVRGVFVLPQRRLAEAAMSPPAVATLGLAVPYAVLLAADWRGRKAAQILAALALGVVLAIAVAWGTHPAVYRAIWAVARSMPFVVAAVGLVLFKGQPAPVAGPSGGSAGDSSRLKTRLLVIAAPFVALVQFPYATPTYFCYAAPVTLLAIVALVWARPASPRWMHVVVAVFFFAFVGLYANRSYGWNLGVAYIPYHPDGRLDVPRGGLVVPADDARTYDALVAAVQQHGAGGTIFAGPDCPEVYFLSGFPNPTRAIFDFLSPQIEDGPWMAGLLARAPIRAAVINTAPLFSPRLDPAAAAEIERRFPHAERFGRFVLRFE